jgi:hypothetical protein
MTPKPLLTSAVIMSAIFLSACESKWSKMPDDELAAKSAECMAESNPSTARIQVCKNYERECERRRSKGIYVC